MQQRLFENSNKRPFNEKGVGAYLKGALIRERRLYNIFCQNGGAYSRHKMILEMLQENLEQSKSVLCLNDSKNTPDNNCSKVI